MSKKTRLTVKDLFLKHSSLNVNWEVYKKVIYLFHELLSQEAIEKGTKIILPKRLGTLQVRKRKTGKKKSVDFHLTKLHGETIYHTNKHSEGYYGTFVWNKDLPQASFSNKQLYSIEMTRTNKRNLSKAIKYDNKINNYIEY